MTICYTATYSPDDNKIRLTASQRLDAETYARVKAAGFKWAPKLEQFIAPMWTPAREDIAIELAGELEDDDSSLTARAEDRAERFEGYSENRLADANRAADAVKALSDNIPLGQPILIGHHSEKHARRDAARIENGMRKAVKMWETSEYWTRRAAGALAHAKYKERPDVRARRIATLEAAHRKMQRGHDETERKRQLWEMADTREKVLAVANYSHLHMSFPLSTFPRDPPASQYEGQTGLWSAVTAGMISWEKARELALGTYTRGSYAEHYRRWKTHYEGRLAYERAMLADQGGTVADQTRPERGGACKSWVSRDWKEIQKVNPKSVTVLDNWGNGGRDFSRTIPFDKLSAVMSRADWLKHQGKPADTPAPAKPTMPPLCNYRTPDCIEMTEEEWKRTTRATDFAHIRAQPATGAHEAHRTRTHARGADNYKRRVVFLTDKPVKEAPKREAVPLPGMPEEVAQ